MTRNVCMWIACASLVGLGLGSAASSLASLSGTGGGGWTFYTPYSQPPQTFAMQIIEASNSARMVLFPLAALSSAGYILLLDRDVRRGHSTRGFEVETGRRSGDK